MQIITVAQARDIDRLARQALAIDRTRHGGGVRNALRSHTVPTGETSQTWRALEDAVYFAVCADRDEDYGARWELAGRVARRLVQMRRQGHVRGL